MKYGVFLGHYLVLTVYWIYQTCSMLFKQIWNGYNSFNYTPGIYAWTFGILRQYDPKFYLKINIGHCDLYFMVQWFCVTSWRLFDVWTSYFGIEDQYDLTFGLKINVGLCDLYFMVQWLCLISPRLVDAWVPYFQIMKQCDPNFDLKVNISQHDLYFMV